MEGTRPFDDEEVTVDGRGVEGVVGLSDSAEGGAGSDFLRLGDAAYGGVKFVDGL